MTFGLTTRPSLAAAVAAGHPPIVPWRASRGQLVRIGAERQAELVGRPVLIHGGIGWGEGEQRDAARLGVDNSACGRIVARAMIAGFARIIDGRVSVRGGRPSWAPDDAADLMECWPGRADQVVLLDEVDPVEPLVAMGNVGGPWSVPSELLARVAPAETSAPACPSCGAAMVWGEAETGRKGWRCSTCAGAGASDAGQPARAPRRPTAARSLEVAFAQVAAEVGIEGWVISDTLPPFADHWITELRPAVTSPRREPWPAPPITIDRRADVAAQALELVELIPRLQAWWSAALGELIAEQPAPGLVSPCAWCEMPTILRQVTGDAVMLEGAGYVDELAEPFGFACSRSGPKGCTALVSTPVACSTGCEREALQRGHRDPSTAISPDADWQRALEQRRLWRAAGEDHEPAVRRAILIRLAEGLPLPAFTKEPR